MHILKNYAQRKITEIVANKCFFWLPKKWDEMKWNRSYRIQCHPHIASHDLQIAKRETLLRSPRGRHHQAKERKVHAWELGSHPFQESHYETKTSWKFWWCCSVSMILVRQKTLLKTLYWKEKKKPVLSCNFLCYRIKRILCQGTRSWVRKE